jgi:hypothetical protein
LSSARVGTSIALLALEEFMSHERVHVHAVFTALSLMLAFITLGAITLFGATGAPANTIEPKPDTLSGWDEYIRNVETRMKERLDGHTRFLWTDESAERRQQIAAGAILVAPMIADGTLRVPHALIHHWIGAVFIPGVTIDSLSTLMLNYSAYKDFYKPTIVDSKLLTCIGSDQTFWMRWQRKVLFVTVSMEGQYQTRHIQVDRYRGYNVADAIQIQEIENYGRPDQRLLPPGTGDGYMWKLHSITRYEERDGGVNLEIEVMALSRDIPFGTRWLVNPIVNRISSDSLTTTLQQTRDAAQSIPALASVTCD